MCKNDIRHQFNVYTSKTPVFVCFAIFKYQLQFCLTLNCYISSVVNCWKTSVSIMFGFSSPVVLFLSLLEIERLVVKTV